jgi:hypothetical protein
MQNKNLIKLSDSYGFGEAAEFIGRLSEGEKYRQDYRNFDFDQKKRMVFCLGKMLNPELEKLKEKIISLGIEPSHNWHMNKDYLPAFTLLQAYFIFVKSYVESFVGFITLYLQDLKNRGISVGEISSNNKYKNLEKLDIDQSSLYKLNKIRSLSIHSKEEGNYSFAFRKTDTGELEFCLIEIEYPEGETPIEKEIYYYGDLTKILEAANSISRKFSDYVNKSLGK